MCGLAERPRSPPWPMGDILLARRLEFSSYDLAVPAADDDITVAAAGKLLGLSQHALEALIERGELEADVTMPTRRRGHRRIRIQRSAVDDFLDRARVKPGELAHLYPAWSGERYRNAGGRSGDDVGGG